MKKLFFKISMLLFVLTMSVNAAWGQELKVYFASLKAQSSPASTGSGDVKLTWVDITGKPMEVSLAKQLNWAAYSPSANWEGANAYASLQTIGQIEENGQYTEDEAREYNAELDGALNSTDELTEEQAAAYNAAMSASKEAGNTLTDEEAAAYNATLSGAKSAGDWKPEPVEGARAFDGPGATAQVIGGTMVAMDGVEVAQEMESQIYMTSYVYYHAEVVPAAGSYLAGWTFTDPAVSRIDTAMGPKAYTWEWNPDINDNEVVLDEENSGPFYSPCFKVLPDTTNNAPYVEENAMPFTYTIGLFSKAHEVANTPAKVNNIYAVFNKYLLSNPTATSGHTNAGIGNSATLNLTLDVEGDVTQYKENYGDFVFPAAQPYPASVYASMSSPVPPFYEDDYGYWTWDLDYDKGPVVTLDANRSRAYVKVTYTTKTADTGTRNATISVRMAHADPSQASTLNIPLSVDVRPAATAEATLYDGKTPTSTSGSLVNMIADANGTDHIVVLNDDYAETLNINVNANVTIDLNGYDINNVVTISNGEVTFAYSKYGGTASSLTVNGGKTILNGGTFGSLTIGTNGEVKQNGATITGIATNDGKLTTTEGVFEEGLTSSKTLNVNGGTFKGTNAIEVSGGTANINKGTLNGTSCGLLVSGGIVTTKKFAVINSDGEYSAQRTDGTLNVDCGKFSKPLDGSINFTSGYFKNNTYGVSTEDKTEMPISAGVEYHEGYRYFLGDAESASANGVPVCRIGTTGYTKLEDALAYANNNPSEELVIFMTNDYTLPAGYYTLPEKATLVVPMSDSQSKEVNLTAPRVVFNDERRNTPYEEPTEFRRLTFASGVNLEVFGQIEMTGSQFASNEAYTSQPTGAYGHLVMEEDSHMTLQSGSEVRVWGFMTGKGETDARRGSKVREMFQLGDWKGAFTSVKIVGMVKQQDPDNPDSQANLLYKLIGDESDKKIFPVTQYFIQNIESPVKYHPGAVLSTSAAVSEGLSQMSVSMAATDIAIVGVTGVDSAIFVMDAMADAENTWVRKWYDAENDIQTYDINSGAHIGQMVLDMGELNVPLGNQVFSVPVRLNSAKFDLPLTSNFKIHLLSGTMDFMQNTSLLPGAEVEIDKESTVTVSKNPEDPEHTGALYVYDAAEWDKYAYVNVDGESKSTAYTKTVRYAPSWNGRPTKRDEQTKPASAAINVHGTFQTSTGFVYTSESGANIFSSNEDAGTFIFNDDATDAGTRTVYNVKGASNVDNPLTFYPARLKNGNGTHVNTNEAVADLAYCYQNDEWSTMIQDGCFMKENRGGNEIYYAKPQEYVAVVATKVTYNEGTEDEYKEIEGNSDHTFSDAAGAGRLFILMDNCQWWEVEKKDNLYHCIHPNNDTYYYWVEEYIDKPDPEDEDSWVVIPGHWEEKRFTITWKNWDGHIIQTIGSTEELVDSYSVTYGTMAEFLGNNPTREKDADSTYNFTGWKPALGPVTQDVTYTATFQGQERKYTITFLNEGGTLIETQYLTHNATPVCENTPTKVGHILQWSPAIGKVVADATYTATWLEEPPTKYEIRFLDYDGTVLKADSVEVGEMPEEPAFPDDKPATAENTYECTSWDAEVVAVTEATTYTAVYTPIAKTFTVIFQNEDETEIERHDYHYGETPVCSATPTKDNTAEWTYGFAWTPQIQTVQGAATYRATFPATKNKYTVTLTSNLSGVCTFTGAGTYDYYNNEGKEPEDEGYVEPKTVTVSYDSEKYNFLGWEDGEENASRTISSLESDVTFTANFSVKSMPNLEIAADGSETLTEPTEVKDFVLTSNGATSGEIIGAGYLDIKGNAIFHLAPAGGIPARTWYAVAVPWQVDVRTGVYNAAGQRLAVGSQFDVIEFDAEAYATQDAGDGNRNIWHYVDETSGIMYPGKLYMVYLASAQSGLKFYKKAGAAIQTLNLDVTLTSGIGTKANWNAIANPSLYHADLTNLNIGGDAENDVVFYNNGGYTPTDAEGLIVGEPVFVQVASGSKVYATQTTGGASPAPAYRRAAQAETNANSRFTVELTRGSKLADRLIVQTAEEKADEYVIGKDIAKMGVSSKVAQMWIDRYDTKLCKNTLEFDGERAEYPLSLFAPAAGEYQISNIQSPLSNDYTLYLTYNGEAIWNLCEGAYTLNLNKGTDANYGLRVSARKTPTGIDEAVVDAQGDTRKVLIDNQVFIIRGEKVYSIDGQLVK